MKNIIVFYKCRIGLRMVITAGWMLLIVIASSCENFLEVELPQSQLTSGAVFEDPVTAHAAMASVYNRMRDVGLLTGYSHGVTVSLGLYADELDYHEPGATNYFYTNSLFASNTSVAANWNEAYSEIYAANAIIEGVTNSGSLPTTDRDQLKGEALFVRALVHFYLVNMYGDIPYIATTDYEQNRTVARMPIAEVYERIIEDLETAAALLEDGYISADRARPNKSTALSLLSRAYLYEGSWAEAANTASAVINNPLYTWELDLDKVFLRESGSTIWQFATNNSGNNTYEAQLFILNGPPSFVAMTESLYNSFEPGDTRKNQWVGTVTDGSQTWDFPYKYKQAENTGSSTEYSIVFRLGEQYLIRAEARAQQGELSAAKADLDKVRNRAGLGNTTAETMNEVLAAIQHERRVELFTEFGHRFFDLKRTGTIDGVLGAAKSGWDSHDKLLPLPETELNANPNLNPQNPGY